VRRAKGIRVKSILKKIPTVEHLIVSLLMTFRLKDKMVIPDLLGLADMERLRTIREGFSDEETPLDQRLQRILKSV
jgi:hypothetical protein